MKIIKVTDQMKAFVAEMAPRDDLGGFSNLSKADLSKASRLDFQYTGLFGETAWYVFRYGHSEETFKKLRSLKDEKHQHYLKTGEGDSGQDDSITLATGRTVLVDVKTTNTTTLDKVSNLNLVVPPRELHSNAIYVAAFTISEDKRKSPICVALAGWCRSDDISERWRIDPKKYAVHVRDLKQFSKLKEFVDGPDTNSTLATV